MRSALGLAVLLLSAQGCGSPSHDAGDTGGPLINGMRQNNGTGIHVGSTQPESWLGLAATSTRWFSDGFVKRSDGSYAARGWYSLDIGLVSADATIARAEQGLLSGSVQSIRTTGTQLAIDVRTSLGVVVTLQGAGLVGLTLQLQVPGLTSVTGVIGGSYRLRFASSEAVDSQLGDVVGHRMEHRSDGLLGSDWSPYCKGPDGEPQRSVFYQGAQWNPMDGSRQDGPGRVTMTCESGSVARCMRWGYRPWATATAAVQSGPVSLADHHQACIHMKRAAYCGDSRTHTIDGTSLYIQDQLAPPLHTGVLDTIEAVWSPSGAVCLSNRRHPELPFLGCAQPLPTCSPSHLASYLLVTGLVPDGSGLGLLD